MKRVRLLCSRKINWTELVLVLRLQVHDRRNINRLLRLARVQHILYVLLSQRLNARRQIVRQRRQLRNRLLVLVALLRLLIIALEAVPA